MKFLFAVLATALASEVPDTADFVCDETCAEGFYTFLATQDFPSRKMTTKDAGVFAYIVYNNYAETSIAADNGVGNIDLTLAFMEGVGSAEACNLSPTWVRDDVAKCFKDGNCDDVDALKTLYTQCDADNNDGCSRIFGLMAANFGAPTCFTDEFPSELTEEQMIYGAKVYEVFMAVMGNWEAMGAACQGKIIEAAGYTAGDDVVLTIAGAADKIIEGAKVEECGYKDGKWDTENAVAATADIAKAGEKLTADVEKAQTAVAKLENDLAAEKETDASPAAILSTAAAVLAMLL